MILPMEKQVCSLESSQKLEKLKFPQESLFYWISWSDGCKKLVWHEQIPTPSDAEIISAYTVAELGEFLNFDYMPYKWMNLWRLPQPLSNPSYAQAYEAEARAKMLIYLAENGLIKP